MRKKDYSIIIGERGSGKTYYEADVLFSMFKEYIQQIHKFNNMNHLVSKVTDYISNVDIDGNIDVSTHIFDKLYKGALLLKLPIDMTYNYDTGLWYMTIEYEKTSLCFTNSDN